MDFVQGTRCGQGLRGRLQKFLIRCVRHSKSLPGQGRRGRSVVPYKGRKTTLLHASTDGATGSYQAYGRQRRGFLPGSLFLCGQKRRPSVFTENPAWQRRIGSRQSSINDRGTSRAPCRLPCCPAPRHRAAARPSWPRERARVRTAPSGPRGRRRAAGTG